MATPEIHVITECFAGPLTAELDEKMGLCMRFLNEKRAEAEDPEDWWDDAYQELLDHEKLGDAIADIRDSVFERCEADADDEETTENFDFALEQWQAIQGASYE